MDFSLREIRTYSNSQLEARTFELVRSDRKIRAQILCYLQVVFERKLHLSYGNSLRRYCHDVLKMSWGSAGHYESATREASQIPDLLKKIERGDLHISTISRVGSFCREQERKNKLEIGLDLKKKIYKESEGKNRDEVDKILFRSVESFGIRPERKENNRPVSSKETLIELVADDELVLLLEEMKMHLSHDRKMGSQASIVKLAVKDWMMRNHPKYRKQNDAARGRGGRAAGQESRTAGKKVRDQIWPDDPADEGCSYVDSETEVRCGSKFQLQADHRKPFALGGKTTEENLRWLCGVHNRFLAEKAGLARPPPEVEKSA